MSARTTTRGILALLGLWLILHMAAQTIDHTVSTIGRANAITEAMP